MSLDAGMLAVARVRRVRESDSRIGLQSALAEYRVTQGRVDVLRERLAAAGGFSSGSAAEFQVLRHALAALGDVLIAAESELDSSQMISGAALVRWQDDKARLSAIELLLERRTAARRTAAARREARDLDDIAAQRWLRARDEAAAHAGTEAGR
ncbi:MAG TPA: flagellar FliJ family protein [Marmoricola sp.]|jgi:flagellar export protein FliJ|nr:flagellar FliJ family protein [Marmoricola sp.]